MPTLPGGTMKSRKWWFWFPGEVYGNDFTFEEPVTQQEARAYVRSWLSDGIGKEVKRLPSGIGVWPG